MSKVGVRNTIIRHSAAIGLTKYWAEEVVTVWNMTHTRWLEDSGEVTLITSKRLEKLCDFIKANENLPIQAIAEQFCLQNNVPFITEDKKKVYLKQVADKNELAEAKEIIKRMLALMPAGYNDMGNSDFISEVREEAEQFLKGH